LNRETTLARELQGLQGLAGVRADYRYTSKNGTEKMGLIMDHYNYGDVNQHVADLCFNERLEALESFFGGLRNLHEKKTGTGILSQRMYY
jgi:hypothetical protein